MKSDSLGAVDHDFLSLPVRGAWIEISSILCTTWAQESLPVRGAWIEIVVAIYKSPFDAVAPRKGSVD